MDKNEIVHKYIVHKKFFCASAYMHLLYVKSEHSVLLLSIESYRKFYIVLDMFTCIEITLIQMFLGFQPHHSFLLIKYVPKCSLPRLQVTV